MEEKDPLPDKLALGGRSASQMLSQTRVVEHSSRTFGIIVTAISVSVTWMSDLAGRCLIFDISSTHSIEVSGIVFGKLTKLQTNWNKSVVCCWHLRA